MLDQHTIQVVKSTIPLLVAAGPELTKHFYQRMFHHNPELKDVFNLAHQHKGDQPVALFNAVAAYAQHIDNLAVLGEAVERIAQKHTGFLIKPEQYAIVGKHLLATLEELGGDAVTPEVLGAWEKAYGVLANIFIGREAQIYADAAGKQGGWSGTRTFVVSNKRRESAAITSFELTPKDGGPVADFKPGQYLNIKLSHPALAHTEIRQYSLADAPNGRSYRIGVKRENEGLVSNLLHNEFDIGSELELIPPAGDFFLNTEPDTRVVLLSAGVGLTPMLSMLNSRLQQDCAETLWLHACENGAQHAFTAEIRRKQAEQTNLKALTWYRQPLETDIQGQDYDLNGTMVLEPIAAMLPSEGQFYCCGPIGFMQSIKAQLLALGIGETQIHYEVFGPHQGL
ncbi:NO-inducible flavohemoprotein [Shewanella algae]|uniref:NO-inducible flavohemoprotein n=1 Tax=Shewanella algae TaxID=38313 RepID=UPI0016564325|nr:NO-inducible flavohemoprotein [Shewanella algae]MBC8796706.1 NO-inducible flavohemoprotein [Shewanella algae]